MKQKKLRIAFFHCAFVYSGGGERIALEGVLGLRARGHSVDLYSPATDWEKCFPDLLKKTQPKPIIPQLSKSVPFAEALNMLVASLVAPLAAYRFKDYDIFIGENQPGVWFSWVYAKMFRKPYIIYLNQPNRMVYPRAIDLKTGWFANSNFVLLEKVIAFFKPVVAFLDKKSIKGANFMTVNGSYIGDVISQIYGKDYIECPAGCDPFPHGPLRFSKKIYYEGYIEIHDKKIKKPYLFLTNRHYPQKRFDYAIEALPHIKKHYPNIQLIISGAFTNVTPIWQAMAKKLGVDRNIVWLGEVANDDMGKLYKNTAVYVYTSPEEDYGMGVVEAEEFGIPVVAWHHAGPTVTVDHGKTGFLAKPYDVKDFAEHIIWLLDNPEERIMMGKKAHEHVQKNFTWKRHVDILEKAAYDALMDKRL